MGGGQVLPGSQVLGENGFNYLIVDGRCHFWARPDDNSDTREGDLSELTAQHVTMALRLGEWAGLEGAYQDGLCDGPTREYRFDDVRINVFNVCHGKKTSAPVDWLFRAATAELSMVYEAGIPVGGPVRFVLVAEPSDLGWPNWWMENAAAWPLTTDPRAIAITVAQGHDYRAGSSVVAPPPEADALRAIRRAFVAKNGLQMTGGFVPVLGNHGDKYELFVRDTIPLEDGLGLLPLD
jgi:hypothetical protein